eukprot:909570-Amphidinium_carterae.1
MLVDSMTTLHNRCMPEKTLAPLCSQQVVQMVDTLSELKIVPPPQTPQQERNHQTIKKERILRTSNIGFAELWGVELGCFPVPTLGSTLGPGCTAAATSASTFPSRQSLPSLNMAFP